MSSRAPDPVGPSSIDQSKSVAGMTSRSVHSRPNPDKSDTKGSLSYRQPGQVLDRDSRQTRELAVSAELSAPELLTQHDEGIPDPDPPPPNPCQAMAGDTRILPTLVLIRPQKFCLF
ncbi:hypothetical protein RRG08_019468 [Elysia crispata]|uniref:Uncharacterized protein n=1 Tax=Elysia crispata TaxID=231223 RepID=A0AAE1A4C6_9GAST|nr:hypothetical protein RRG08_019468 [Elysia crispata]